MIIRRLSGTDEILSAAFNTAGWNLDYQMAKAEDNSGHVRQLKLLRYS